MRKEITDAIRSVLYSYASKMIMSISQVFFIYRWEIDGEWATSVKVETEYDEKNGKLFTTMKFETTIEKRR